MVKVLKIDLRKEVEYVSGVIREYTKNYQVWYVLTIIYVYVINQI